MHMKRIDRSLFHWTIAPIYKVVGKYVNGERNNFKQKIKMNLFPPPNNTFIQCVAGLKNNNK